MEKHLSMLLHCQIEAFLSNGPSRNGGRPDRDGILFGGRI
jgi:hypothetical protein